MKRFLFALLIAICSFFIIYFFFGKFSQTYFGVSYSAARQEDEFRKSLRETGAYSEDQITEIIEKSRKAWRIGTDKIGKTVSDTISRIDGSSLDLSRLTQEQLNRLNRMVDNK